MSVKTPEDLRYTKEHEWVRVEGDQAVIGITEFAQASLGDIVFVELPAEGDDLTQNESFGTVEAVKAVSDLFSPISGQVVAVNEKLADEPATVNESPYEDGWMIRARLRDPSEIESLMSASDYQTFVAGLEEGD